MRDPLLNKGTAFSEEERDAFGLRGLLPAHVFSQEEQAARVLTNLRHLPDDSRSTSHSMRCTTGMRLSSYASYATISTRFNR